MRQEENGRPLLVLLAGPSGVGKDAVRDALREQHPHDIHAPVSATTRKPREGEQDGREYRFVDGHIFQYMEDRGMFAETAMVHGHRYGTPREELAAGRYAGLVSILKVDVQGAEQLKRQQPRSLGIFLLPESARQLRERLEARGMNPADIETRLEDAHREIARSRRPTFDTRITNREGRLDDTVREAWRTIEHARMERGRNHRKLNIENDENNGREQVMSPYAKAMLDEETAKFADHEQGEFARRILQSVKDALFGPPSREAAGTCGECGGVADVFGEDFCRTCWGE